MNQDLEHLRLLSIFHYIVGGMMALFACFPLIHFTLGAVMLFAPSIIPESKQAPHQDAALLSFAGGFMMLFAGLFILLGWATAICVFLAGRNLKRQRHYTFCMVMAGILCMFMPFGTILGAFTIIVLIRPSVKALFEPPQDNPFVTAV
jgi:hypothetical protein